MCFNVTHAGTISSPRVVPGILSPRAQGTYTDGAADTHGACDGDDDDDDDSDDDSDEY